MEYFSEDYYDALVEALNDDEDFKKKTKDYSTTVVQVAKDKEKAFRIDIDDGTVTAEPADLSEEGEFRFVADYDDWAKVVQGETTAEKLIMSGKMKVDGSMGKLLRHRDKLEFLTKAGRDLSPSV